MLIFYFLYYSINKLIEIIENMLLVDLKVKLMIFL